MAKYHMTDQRNTSAAKAKQTSRDDPSLVLYGPEGIVSSDNEIVLTLEIVYLIYCWSRVCTYFFQLFYIATNGTIVLVHFKRAISYLQFDSNINREFLKLKYCQRFMNKGQNINFTKNHFKLKVINCNTDSFECALDRKKCVQSLPC